MKRFAQLLFTVFLYSFLLIAQQDDTVVAKVGNESITARELKLRIELSPYIPTNPKTDRNSESELKSDFLYSLIAEKLWAKEAEDLGLDQTENFRFNFKPIEDLFIRDALFKNEVEDKVKLSEKDIIEAINKSQFKLTTRIFSSTDSLEILKFYVLLKLKVNIDSLVAVNNIITSDETEITLGKLKNEKLEDTLYLLNPGQFTLPSKTDFGWVIFELKNKTFIPFDVSDQKSVTDMKKVLRERRIEERYNRYMKELLGDKKVAIDQKAFMFVYNKLWDIIKSKSVRTDTIAYYPIMEKDFNSILNSSTEEELNQPLFTWERNNFTVKKFLSELSFHRFSVGKIDSTELLVKLNQRAKQFVENELITLEGYRQELQLKPSVRKDIAEWRQNYLAQFYSNAVLDSVNITDAELYNYYLSQIANAADVKLINLRMVTLDDLDEISKIFDKLKKGKNFADVIKQYGQTDSLLSDEGESGLKPVILFGEIGKVASNLNPGEIYGPIKRKNSYSIIQLIEKKDMDDSLKLSFDKIKDILRYEYRVKKLADKLNEITSKLAVDDNVKIYRNELDKIKITNIPMFLHRFMGFGGRIAGMPLLTPFSEWIDKVDTKKLLP